MYDTKNGLTNSMLSIGLIFSILMVLFYQIGVFAPVYPSFKNATESFQLANYSFFQNLKHDLDFFFNIEAVRIENIQLENDKESLMAENQTLKEALQDYEVIKNQNSFNKDYYQEPVRVLQIQNNQTELLINKGSDYKIKLNDVAVIENNLLGIVTEVNENYAKVRLITNPESKVPVIVTGVNTKGVAVGVKVNSVQIEDIPNDKTLNLEDTVIAAGTDGIVPYGLVLGRITNIKSDPTEINQSASLVSNIKFNNLNSLFVIIKDYNEN